MNNLSEFFKSKLNTRTFGRKEEGWSAMQEMLDKTMPVKKKWYQRRRFFLWLIPLLSVFTLYAIFQGVDSSSSISGNESTISVSPNQRGSGMMQNSINWHEPASLAKSTKPLAKEKAISSVSLHTEVASVHLKEKRIIPRPTSSDAGRNTGVINKGVSSEKPPAADEKWASLSQKQTLVSSLKPTASVQEASVLLPDAAFTAKDIFPIPSVSFATLKGSEMMFELSATRQISPSLFFPKNWFLSASVSVGVLQAMQTNTSMQAMNNMVLRRRVSEEKNMFVPITGVDVKLHVNGFTMGAGLQFSQWGEGRNYADDFLRKQLSDSLSRTYVDNSYWDIDSLKLISVQYSQSTTITDTVVTYYSSSSNTFQSATVSTSTTTMLPSDTLVFYKVDSTFVQRGDSLVTVYRIEKIQRVLSGGTAGLKGRNVTTYAELPLMLGYEWRAHRWGLGVEAGVAIGRLLSTHTSYLSPDESGLIQVAGNQYRQWLMNYQARLNISYRLNHGLRLEFSPLVRRTAQGVFSSGGALQQRYTALGASIGLRYSF